MNGLSYYLTQKNSFILTFAGLDFCSKIMTA